MNKEEAEKLINKYDENEIQILNESGELVGYVAEIDSPVFAKLMDAGKKLFAVVKKTNFEKSVPIIEIDIYLRDY